MDYLVHHLLRASARRLPNKEALVHNDERLSYTEVEARTSALAAQLVQSGVRRGERIAIYLDPSVPQVISIFAASAASAVFVPINTLLVPEQVAHIARDCSVSALITTVEKLGALADVIRTIASLKVIIAVGSDAVPDVGVPVLRYEGILQSNQAAPSDVCISKDLAAILYTSGSTGKPKGVMLSHANIIAGGTIVSTYLRITDKERILAVLPFSFDAGLNQLITAFQQGSTLVLIRFVFARDIVQKLLEERITALAGVPTVWSLLAQNNSGMHRNAFPELRYITNTGGAMPQAVLAVLRQILPTTKIFLMYGLTEAFRSTYLPPEELDRRPTSMGKAIPDTEILVVDEHGNRCGAGEVGELVHRGPTVSLGYWGNREATDRVLRSNPLARPELGDSERVCYSGDLVKTDEEGFLYYVARRDAMIKSSGYRISPTEVEEVLFQTGNVRQAAAIGVPDEVLGQAIKVFVVAKDGAVLDRDSLLAFVAAKLPRYMVPKYLEVMQELPKTSSGKVDYPELRKREGL